MVRLGGEWMGTAKREGGGRVSHWETEREPLKKERSRECGPEGSTGEF